MYLMQFMVEFLQNCLRYDDLPIYLIYGKETRWDLQRLVRSSYRCVSTIISVILKRW